MSSTKKDPLDLGNWSRTTERESEPVTIRTRWSPVPTRHRIITEGTEIWMKTTISCFLDQYPPMKWADKPDEAAPLMSLY